MFFRLVLLLGLIFSSIAQAQILEQENQFGQSFADLVDKLVPGVVNISTLKQSTELADKVEINSTNEHIRNYFLQDEGGRVSLGSGFLIDGNGYIITNNHVIDGADSIVVKLYDDSKYDAKVIGSDKMTDLALIKIDADKELPFVKLGDSDKLRVGDWILAIGNPFGLGGSVTAGIVSAKSRDIDAGSYDNFIQTDASINQGSSGGPMFNMKGEVVGVNTAIFSSNGGSMGIGFATPINLSKFVVSELMSKGKVERGWIGVKASNSDEEIPLSEQNTFKGGVMVNSVSENSPAAASGIKAGDIIIALNGVDVKDVKHFSRNIAETPVGKNIMLRVWQDNRIKDFELTVSLMPEQKTVAEPDNLPEEAEPEGYIAEAGMVLEKNAEGKIVISEVLADSDAAQKGLSSGDIIQKANGKNVSSIEDMVSYVAYAISDKSGQLELLVLSNGIPQTLQLKVGNNE